jgi:hypothetical protein
VTVTGEFGSAVDGWPEDREYMPAYIDMFGLGLQPEVDEHGNPKPVKLMGMSGFGYSHRGITSIGLFARRARTRMS